jgi:hypothetical protein
MINSKYFFERNLIRIGLGLGFFIVISVTLNLLNIPLDWRIFLLLSSIIPLFVLLRNIKINKLNKFNVNLKKIKISELIVLLIFIISLYMYSGGAFKYPYLENNDSWDMAFSSKYIAIEKIAYEPDNYDFTYLEPYPPGYSILMGILHQTSSSISWTLKFFNGLIISLGLVFFYLFAKRFTGNNKGALFSMFVLAAIPSYFTHNIWATTLGVMLFFPLMYCLEMIDKDKKWVIPGAITWAAMLLVQPSLPIKFIILIGIYIIIKSIIKKEILKYHVVSILCGFILSLTWWFNQTHILFLMRIQKYIVNNDTTINLFGSLKNLSVNEFSIWMPYRLKDFLIAKVNGGLTDFLFKGSLVDEYLGGTVIHIGLGLFVSLIVVLSLFVIIRRHKNILNQEQQWIQITVLWFIFGLMGVNGIPYIIPINFVAFRFWIVFAISVALLCPLGLIVSNRLAKVLHVSKKIMILIIILGIVLTSGYQKFSLNTSSNWPYADAWSSREEAKGNLWLKTLPTNTKVFPYLTNHHYFNDRFVIGLDKYSCAWCDNIVEFRKDIINKNLDELYNFLKSENYEYIIISEMSYKIIDDQISKEESKETIDRILKEIRESSKFSKSYKTKDVEIFRVN